MGQIIEYIKIAIMNIRHNRGRSALTMLGIIIGITSVIMVISIGNGMSASVNSELDGLAGGQIVFYVDQTRKDTYVTMDWSDIDAIKEQVDHILGASPQMTTWGTCTAPKVSMDLLLNGGTPDYYYNSKEDMLHGRYFNQSDYDAGSAVCVLTDTSARMMFGTDEVVGLEFEASVWGISQNLKIIGVRKDANSSLISMLQGSSDYISVDVPLSFMATKYGFYIDDISQFYIYSEGAEYSNEVAAKAKKILESRHHCQGENQIMMQSFADVSGEFESIMSIITLFVSFVAAISLLVGGIGVMNIMLVSVTERTREIGIRKSLGARTNSIMWQFLSEAGIITLIGGIIGIILGVLGAVAVCAALGMKASVSPVTVIVATAFSCAVGIFFGIYPAKKAAKLSPIEALRHE
ncbi:MAG: ABC transporter permease [Lachnospiraceae bacterium]|nr:ABC transporter permease [Lachnospiraceae bacterium]